MRLIVILLLCAGILYDTHAQSLDEQVLLKRLASEPVDQSSSVIKSLGLSILWVIKTNDAAKEIVINYLLMNASNIQKLEFMDKDEAARRFGLKFPKEQACIITPKPSARIVRLLEYYELQKIGSEFKKPPLVIDGKFVADTINVFIDVNSVATFKASSDTMRLMSSAYATQLKNK